MEAQSDQVFVPEASDSYSYPPVPAPVPADDIRTQVINAIAPVLIELATEIRRSLDYYSTRYQMRPEQIFLCGGTARMYNLDQFLTNELGIPVQVANPMANLMVQCPKYTPDHLQEISPLFPVSIGLAIREMLE
ncbi:MAG TPA: pilus assembly protein PilM [Armatimonadota bacterium]|nr:pilus assembly protein PilM [Armatimonadota bacterium]